MTQTTDLAQRLDESATVEQRQPTAAGLITNMQAQFARALPAHIPPERFVRIAITALRQNPALGRCTPESLLGALLTCAQLGLEPNTPQGEAYLIPYGRVCTFVPGYRGLATLAWNSGSIAEMYAELVHEKDVFRFTKGLHRDLVHEPHLGDDAGPIIGAYAVVKMKDGGVAFDYWTIDQIRRHQAAHSQTPSSKAPADIAGWMDRKVVLKQVLKLVPSSPTLATALANDGAVRTDLSFQGIDLVEGEAVEEAQVVEDGAP